MIVLSLEGQSLCSSRKDNPGKTDLTGHPQPPSITSRATTTYATEATIPVRTCSPTKYRFTGNLPFPEYEDSLYSTPSNNWKYHVFKFTELLAQQNKVTHNVPDDIRQGALSNNIFSGGISCGKTRLNEEIKELKEEVDDSSDDVDDDDDVPVTDTGTQTIEVVVLQSDAASQTHPPIPTPAHIPTEWKGQWEAKMTTQRPPPNPPSNPPPSQEGMERVHPDRKKRIKEKPEEKKNKEIEEVKNVPIWMQMRENLDLDKIAHKLISSGGLNPEEILATAGPELVQRCTGISTAVHRNQKSPPNYGNAALRREKDGYSNIMEDMLEMLIDGGSGSDASLDRRGQQDSANPGNSLAFKGGQKDREDGVITGRLHNGDNRPYTRAPHGQETIPYYGIRLGEIVSISTGEGRDREIISTLLYDTFCF
ncbi:hypothetical protein BGX38DRAFT_1333327 [Terfezia claveryi]|nr:hypothetical protein BGX38DRAFT_1333327 [Terfezia claveryi]